MPQSGAIRDTAPCEGDRLSVVIPCRNEAADLPACLRSLNEQTRPPLEILVVDDGSVDGSAQVAQRLAAELAVPLRVIRGAARGAAAARNTGAQAAAGNLIAFCEADATYSAGYLAAAVAALTAPDASAAIGGLRRVWAERANGLARAWNALFHARWDQLCQGRRRPLGAWAFRREDFLRWGGYDEQLTVGEDRDLVERIRMTGGQIAFFADAEVRHRDPTSWSGIWRRGFWGGRHGLPFRRRWGHPWRDLLLAALLLLLPWIGVGALVGVPRLWPLLFAAAGLMLLAPADVRGAMRAAREARDVPAALIVPLLFAVAKQAAAAGLWVALLEPRRPSASCSPRSVPRRVDFLAWRPLSNASARCRGAAYIPHLWRRGWELRFRSPGSPRLYQLLNDRRGIWRVPAKAVYLLLLLPLWRLRQIVAARDADLVIVQRELHPWGPPLLERLLARLQPRLLLDIDDAIDRPPPHLRRASFHLHDWNKLAKLVRYYRRLLVASPALEVRGRELGFATRLLPTAVDTERIRPAAAPAARAIPALGWTGTAGNFAYLEAIVPALRSVQEHWGCDLVVISESEFAAPGLRVLPVRWCQNREVADLRHIDIGLMPLADTPYARAKAGHKILTYWAAGLPVVASPVGVNADLIRPGVDGLLASSTEEWRTALERLIADAELRQRLGRAGRARVEREYAQSVLAARFVEILDEAWRERAAASGGGTAPRPAGAGGF